MSKWISVKDKLPEQYITVLFACKRLDCNEPFVDVLQGYLSERNTWVSYLWNEIHDEVTHWTPNRKPPK